MPAKRTRRPTSFNLKKFLKDLQIDKSEHALITQCFTRGVANYYRHIYGYDKYGAEPAFMIGERMYEPYIFGFGAVEVVREEDLLIETQLKIVQSTLDQIDTLAEYGTPHGLPILLSYLARIDRLTLEMFRGVMVTTDFAGSLFDDWTLAEVGYLTEWIVTNPEMPDAERVWWLWHISLKSEPPHLSKPLAESFLAHAALPEASKQALCLAWLTDTPAGEPPAQWEAMQDLMQGDVQSFVQHAQEAGMPIPDNLPTAEAMDAEFDSALDNLLDDNPHDDDDIPPMSFNMMRNMLVGPMGMVVLTPLAFRRVAVGALPRLGEDPLAVCQRYLGTKKDYDGDPLNNGVADVIRAYHQQMPADQVRALVERGVTIPSVPTRKTFYQLGHDLYGENYLARATKDSANSIREWAKKKGQPPAKRGRKPKAAAPKKPTAPKKLAAPKKTPRKTAARKTAPRRKSK